VDEEFMDIPISNVEITFRVFTSEGKQLYSTGIQYSRPLPLKVYGILALRQGVPVGVLNLVQEAGPPPFPECFQVLIATDERAMWGRNAHIAVAIGVPILRVSWRRPSAVTAGGIPRPMSVLVTRSGCMLRPAANFFGEHWKRRRTANSR
jgi:hypothetical protein